MMSNIRKSLTAVAVIALLGAPAFAQQQMPQQQQAPEVDVDDDELETFAEVLVDVQVEQQDAQSEVQGIIEDSDLDMQRFQEIYQQEMAPNMGGEGEDGEDGEAEIDTSEEEQEEYDRVLEEVESVESESVSEMEDTVEDGGMEVDRFNELAQGIPQDQELAQELNEMTQEIMEERDIDMGGQGQGQF
ncbi:MAG: DUF4168 domain-containing protein [Spirochaetales bacterium]